MNNVFFFRASLDLIGSTQWLYTHTIVTRQFEYSRGQRMSKLIFIDEAWSLDREREWAFFKSALFLIITQEDYVGHSY